MSGYRYDFSEWAEFLFPPDPTGHTSAHAHILDRFGDLQTFTDKVFHIVERVCESADVNPPGVGGMHRATYLCVADYVGHGVGLWEVEDDEPWAAKLRPVILADAEFQAALEGLQ